MSQAFAPFGPTIVIPADATAPTGVQAVLSGISKTKSCSEYLITNPSTLIVHLGWGSSAAVATANAVAAVAGTPANSLPIMPSSSQVLRFGIETYFSGLSSAANSIYITPGEGL